MKRAWLHTTNRYFELAYPVEVLTTGKKFCSVRLLHKTSIGNHWLARGTVRTRVPIGCISDHPIPSALVSLGGGRFASKTDVVRHPRARA